MTRRASILCAWSFLLLAPVQAQTRVRATADAYGRVPLHFERNEGQTDARVRHVARGAGYAFFITETETVTVLQKKDAAPAVLRMRLLGANEHPSVEGEALFEGRSHYLLGSDPSGWRTNVPQFGKVRLSQVYDGIDAVYYGNQGEIEYDFLVAPGIDPRQIRMQFHGAEHIEIEESGDLLLHVAGGTIRQKAPFAYQQHGDSRRTVAAHYYRLAAREFGIELGAYDPSEPLVIDPVLAWSTYLGGNHIDEVKGMAIDGAGHMYVTGWTVSANFPTANAVQPTPGDEVDAFVTKLNADGSALVYSTYLGGFGLDEGEGIAVDSAGQAFIAGFTQSIDFPTANAFQSARAGSADAFVTKLNAAGNALVYSSYLGGAAYERATRIEVDASGNAYVAGYTNSVTFPTANALQASYGGGADDAFLTKLNAAGSALVYSTFLGGSGFDLAYGLAVDGSGNAFLAGITNSPNFPTANAMQAGLSGVRDAFVAKINAAGNALVYSTYLGGSDEDDAFAVAVDGVGNAYVAGSTNSANFPTANALQAALASADRDGFVTKLNAAGSALVYSTYLGGNGPDWAFGIALDGSGNAHVAGGTGSANFPTANAMQPALAGIFDAFVTRFNASGSALVYSTYLGGSAVEETRAIALDASGVYLAGSTESTNFPTVHPLQSTHGGWSDGFLAKLVEPSADLTIMKVATGAFVIGEPSTFTITVTNGGPTAADDVTVTDVLPAGATFVSATPSQGSCSGTTTVTCTLGTIAHGSAATIVLVVRPTAVGPLSNTATVTSTTPDGDSLDNASTAPVQVQPAPAALAAVPTLDPTVLMVLATLLAGTAMWMMGRRGM